MFFQMKYETNISNTKNIEQTSDMAFENGKISDMTH